MKTTAFIAINNYCDSTENGSVWFYSAGAVMMKFLVALMCLLGTAWSAPVSLASIVSNDLL